ncbi:MAG: hypothetical protein V7638_2398 [Acidobacteriota bacterium]|jgi:type I restriction-modification system DNA methylase subunit
MDDTLSIDSQDSAESLLQAAYTFLGYNEGSLLLASPTPKPDTIEIAEWLEKGDWLALAHKIGAERVFFVNNDPVIVFYRFEENQDDETLISAFRQAWCMARPSCLFIAVPGELRVYSLNQTPARNSEEWNRMSPLAIVQRATEVGETLNRFRREEMESGRVFADIYFGDIDSRADRRFIRDLKNVRKVLLGTGLLPKYAHALIGRSIFVRYLEDREVLTPEYFEHVAKQNPEWRQLLLENPAKPDIGIDLRKRRYHNVLRNKEFTYALYNQLSLDFNGDMFPRNADEELAVDEAQHLLPLREFLLGEGTSDQLSLFFWAYDFEIIPVELISSIYEEFYHYARKGEDEKSTHYTPTVLVDYVLSRVLKKDKLDCQAKVLDPACGSGIFLVEAFRRIVRYRVQQRDGQMLSPTELRHIIRDQITGIEINPEATRVAAFSLYLALLHYQDPPDIRAHPRLPNIVFEKDQAQDENHYATLYNANTFDLTPEEIQVLKAKLATKTFAGRASLERLLDTSEILSVQLNSYDVIVGNPPWDEPKKTNDPTSVALLKQGSLQAIQWAKAFNLPVGDNSPSQQFVHRALTLIKPNGSVGLLVHSSVIFNQRATSQKFRRHWLSTSTVTEVVNFAHVRRLFFDKAIAPFVFLNFSPRAKDSNDDRFVYLSARLTKVAKELRIVALSNADRRIVRQSEIKNKDYLWKTYWWGSHRDVALLSRLDAEDRLQNLLNENDAKPQYGFQIGTKLPTETLQSLRQLNSKKLKFYGPLREEWFEDPPRGVKRQPDERLYQGQRLLVVRGIKARYGAFARLEYDKFSFRHTIYCVPLPSLEDWQVRLLLGVFWSSLGRYRMFMTSGRWGAWHDETVPSDVLSMPIRIPSQRNEIANAVINAVDAIRQYEAPHATLRNQSAPPTHLIETLDRAIFELFGLLETERDLINDFIKYTFDLFINGPKSHALKSIDAITGPTSGTISDLLDLKHLEAGLAKYLHVFLTIWNSEIELEGEFSWQVVRPPSVAMVAVVFNSQGYDEPVSRVDESDVASWKDLLKRCEMALKEPVTERIYIDGMIRAVSDTQIIIVKRDERRLWTRSMAREDAEATLLQAVRLQEHVQTA